MIHRDSLVALPVELLYEIQLFSISPSLPLTCKTLYGIFSASPSSYRAQYLIASVEAAQIRNDLIPSKLLRYPICTMDTLEAVFRISSDVISSTWRPELPRRLFRSLTPGSHAKPPSWTDQDHPLPFLKYLFACPKIHPPDVNSHEGYALTKAVQVGFVPLIRFLLDHGASPRCKNSMSIIVAIYRKDISLVRLLVDRVDRESNPAGQKEKGTRRKLEDRAQVTPEMLKVAVKLDARDIVEYLMKEKGCVPDMQTLLMMR
ncbi:hypothetical protein DEU56DRAFT_38041 [Suillus clintonianus]|uniref:uncharacterized protein n=1 Tax=Suillus clintonianus TaxID=1904413 RepID=UPI001B85DC2B|nr:uncharacterized protein DEU56DRAFT_38041 [Suillus clintonianus]KAG2150620.1 hypothetical protein DEU56DRAFT_38041 [Suillus clintonianus]